MNEVNNSDWVSVKRSPDSSINPIARKVTSEKPMAKISDSGSLIKIFDFLITFSLGALFFGLPLFFSGATFQGLSFDKQMYFYFWIILFIF